MHAARDSKSRAVQIAFGIQSSSSRDDSYLRARAQPLHPAIPPDFGNRFRLSVIILEGEHEAIFAYAAV
jgi:hypothetical protein